MLAEFLVEGVSFVGNSLHLGLNGLDLLKGPLLVLFDLHVLAAGRGEHRCHLAVTVGARADGMLGGTAPLRDVLVLI